jgi:hypothetical protein
MATITGSGGDYSENYSRRGNAARGNEQNQNFLAEKLAQVMAVLEGAGQGIAGLFQGGAPNTTANNILITGDTPNDPRITGTTEDPRVTQSGGRGGVDVRRPITGTQVEMAEDTRRGGGQSSIPTRGSRGGGTPPADDVPNPNQRGGLLASTRDLLGGALEADPIKRNIGRLGYLAPVAAAFQDYTEGGNPYAIGGGAAAGLGVTALTRSAGRSVGGGKGAVLQMLAPLLGLGTQQLTTAAIQKDRQRKTGEGDPNAFSTQLGRLEQLRKIGNEGQIQMMNAERAGVKDIYGYMVDKDRENIQAMAPLIEQQRNNDVVRQQQIMNAMGQNFAMLGSMATTGKLALGAQTQAGANLRTMMTAAPYANSVLQAPNISF